MTMQPATCARSFLLFLTLSVQIAVSAEVALPLAEIDADPAIPTSQQVLRYDWGQEVSSHRQIEVYLQALAAAAPDRTRLVEYGRSREGRSLNYLVITSAGNLSKLDELQERHLQLCDPRDTPRGTAEQWIEEENMPAVVWLAYAVHGNEISPSDAALLTAYHLLADRRPATQDVLERLIVIIDPLQNPDGRDRFVNVFRETRGLFNQSQPYANEHTERWPSGRSNHYWFDMNRDWFRQSQQEVVAKVAAYLRWQPQIYVDAHEMGANSSFYFPPPADPKNPYLLPSQNEWFSRLGRHQAGWFDRYGFGYMTREVFDAFYPGYGSEWPTLQGGLGVLWEQASARGLVIRREDETDLTYADGVRNHYVSGLATTEFAAEHRKELLTSFYEARVRSIQLAAEGDTKHYFLLPGERPQRAKLLATTLQRNGIEVSVLEESLDVNCSDTKDGEEKVRSVPAGSYHISVAQPTGRLVRSLLDRTIEMDERFLRRQLERNQLRLPDEIYDVTAWSLPLAFDVPCWVSGDTLELAASPFDPSEPRSAGNCDQAQVAYLIDGTDGAMRLVAALLQQDVRVHVSDAAFKLQGRPFQRGTVIVKVSENGANLHTQLQELAEKFDVAVVPTDTAFVDEGVHMGGPKVKWVRPPKVLLVVHQPTHYSSGHTWFLFDDVLSYPTTRVRGQYLSRVTLSDFNTLVLPDGNYSKEAGFDADQANRLKEWVQGGGTLILLRGATQWAADADIGLIKNRIVKRKIESEDDEEDAAKIEVTPDNVPGAFFRAQVFQKHWVTFGYRPSTDVFYAGRLILAPTRETEGRSLVRFADQADLLTSGFCWPANLELLARTPYVVYRSMGRGHVIAFTDDPNFRAMYPSLQRLFINAAMFGAGH